MSTAGPGGVVTLKSSHPSTPRPGETPGFLVLPTAMAQLSKDSTDTTYQGQVLLIAVVKALHLFFERIHNFSVPCHVGGQDQCDHPLNGKRTQCHHIPGPQRVLLTQCSELLCDHHSHVCSVCPCTMSTAADHRLTG